MLFHIFIGKCKQLVHYGRLLLFLTNFYFYIIDGGLFIFEAHSLAVWFLMHLSSCVRDYVQCKKKAKELPLNNICQKIMAKEKSLMIFILSESMAV